MRRLSGNDAMMTQRQDTLHVPVMLEEVLQVLEPRTGGLYLDGTLGSGGYAEAILRASEPDGRVIGLDLDPLAIQRAGERLALFGDRFRAVHAGFHDASAVLESLGIDAVDGVALDLGLSSMQLDDPERGFSFRFDSPLDMRFDTKSGEQLADYLGKVSMTDLEEILESYGEERYGRKLARGILQARDRGTLNNTADLVAVVSRILGRRRGKIHPATRTFQALRIAVNRELENLSTALDRMPPLLKKGAVFCVVSYHSLEDRLVKFSFRAKSKGSGQWSLMTPKPMRPTVEETKRNPRARSARLRAIRAEVDHPAS
jgi:16S rRNA (cytosine1402-N4)-methyltransferase